MSNTAHREFSEAFERQATRNDALRIRTKVQSAQANTARTGVRWPFELIQNAHDAGPRIDQKRVQIDFLLRNTTDLTGQLLEVSHTGNSFTAQELAALLSGGSSKDFDDEETTGRFGTGFLVTHGLSPRVDVDGIISTQAGSERFHIKLIRDGDEAAITKNIEQARQSLKDAEVVPQPELLDGSTALFKYHDICPIVAQKGLERLHQTIPYLYATCKHLGRVRIIEGDAVTVFEPGLINDRALGQCTLREVQVTVTQGDSQHITVARLGYKDGRSALLSVIEKRDNEERLRLPQESFPRLFVTFPIAGSGILPFNVVLDGQFTPEQERDGILLDHHDKSLIEAALSCLPTFVRHAVESHWTGAHNLAQLAAPTTVFTGEDDSGESEWWKTVILKTAKAIASEAIIETEAGLLPALSRGGGDAVCFLVPSISAEGDTLFAYERIHDLAATLDGLHIPKQDIAQEWREIADHWTDVGVAVQRLGFQELTDWVKAGRECMEDLPVLEDRFQWITRLFVLAADLADTHTVSHMLDKLLPNQHSEFCSSVQLSPDRDVSTGINSPWRKSGIRPGSGATEPVH